MKAPSRLLWLLAVAGGLVAPAQAQTPSAEQRVSAPPTLTLQAALAYAVEHYPTIKVAREHVNTSVAGVSVARSAALPRLDSLWQVNRATVNNVTGLLLPQSVLPAISGPPLVAASASSAWGSAAGAFLSWEPFDFGSRDASVRSAEAAVARARADESLTRLEVQSAVGAAFLAVVQAERAVGAAQADVERRQVLALAARTLADNQLRPGAEASRADAERAAAETRAILTRQTLAIAQTTLARTLGVTTGSVTASATNLLEPASGRSYADQAAAAHPLAQARQASVDLARTQEDVLAYTNRPRLYVQSALFARGSGATSNGALDGGVNGVGLERANWAAGVQVVFPDLFSFTSLRARRSASAATTRAERARHEEALLMVTSQQHAASAMVEAARAVAAHTPVQLAAARHTEVQATVRYRAGLASIVEVADAQNLLVQAEYQDAVARVDVWRALLAEGVAHGDLTPLVSLLSSGAR